jgi:hypothetical protein
VGQRAEELKREIEESRDYLGGTLDAIGDRVSPGRMMDRRKARFRQRITSVRETVMGAADTAQHRLGGAAAGLSDKAGELTGSTKEAVQDKASSAKQAAHEGSPLLAGALAFGAGFLLATVLPEGEAESRTAEQMAEKLGPARQQLMEAGQELAESAREAGNEAMGELKSQAEEGAQQVKEAAGEAAATVKEEAESAGQDVKTQAESEAKTVKAG